MAARLASILVAAIVGTTLIAGLIVGAQRDDNSGPVDLIIHNAKVYEADDLGSMAEAVAIRGNKILKAGSEREIMRYRRPQTMLIDARGGAVLPGFNDAHVAMIAGGLAHDSVQLHDVSTLEEIQARVSAFAETHPDAAWISGIGWNYDSFADQPTRAQLDAAVKSRPVRLLSEDGHALWVNTKALQAASIGKRTPNPADGVIVRDRRGDATGLLKDAAIALVERVTPKPTREDRAKALQVAIREAQRRGVTSVQDLGAEAGDIDLYDAAREAGTLPLRVYAAIGATRTPLEDLAAIAKRHPDDPLLKTGLATIALDGSVESQTAAMLSAYAGKAGGEGILHVSEADLTKLVATLDADGWQIAIDAAGDRAARAALDAYGAAAKRTRAGKPARHRIEGITVVDAEDVPRFGALGVVASMQPLRTGNGGLLSWSKSLGPDRALLGWPSRSLSAAGAHLAFDNNWPNLALDPLASIRAAVARPEMHAPEQLSLKSAINAWTSGAAWASLDDHRKGTIKPGMLADIVILSTDIFRGAPQLNDAEVVTTIFDGKVVYRRPS